MDPSIEACNNFYRYANGTWLKKTEIPAAFPSWGTWDILVTRNREKSREILETAMKEKLAPGTSRQLIGDYYASCMDEAAIEAAGIKPLDPFFKEIDSIKDIAGLRNAIAMLHKAGSGPLFAFYSYLDDKDSTINIANVYQGGLGLPNSDYYIKTDENLVDVRPHYKIPDARISHLRHPDTRRRYYRHRRFVQAIVTKWS